MESRVFDLNETPRGNQGSSFDYVLLQKDFKNICCAKIYDLPIKVPLVWSVVDFVPAKAYQPSDFSKFSLLPAPENDKQSTEWQKFMRYLRDSKKAGIVTFGSATFHILAPQPVENFSYAVLMFEHKQVTGQSGRHVNSPVVNVSKGAYRNQFQHGFMNEKPYFNKEIYERESSPAEMDTSRKYHERHASELHRSVLEPSPVKSVEDCPRSLDPIRKKSTATPAKNFFILNPSFLQTLGEAHDCWIFGALAELIDNSRDAGSSRLDISIESMFMKKEDIHVPVLSVIDDGHGMTYADMMKMISFGHKGPNKRCPDKIGRCGVGFKTGAMKLGKDVVVLTQTSSSRSVTFLSQSFNKEKDNVEIPVVTYRKKGQHMELDLDIHSEATAKYNLNAIKNFSPFTKYYLGEKLGLFGTDGTGTQIYIWNLDKWGTYYTFEWHSGKSSKTPVHNGRGDILIRSRKVRSRPGQTSNRVPLDYSLQSSLEVMFLDPCMEIFVQGSLVESRPLAEALNKTSIVSGEVMGKTIELTLGMSNVEYERINCGIFLYWHGRLIEPYKRVGGQKHSADTGRGLIGVADVTELMDEDDGKSLVLNNKQGFTDCEIYAKLEEWLGRKVDDYWDTNYDNLEVRKGGEGYKNKDHWVQCYSCRKWRVLNAGFIRNKKTLPPQWFCYMPPFNGKCETPQQKSRGSIIIAEDRSGYEEQNRAVQREKTGKKGLRSEDIEVQRTSQVDEHVKATPATANKENLSSNDVFEGAFLQTEDNASRPTLKRLRRGPPRSYKEMHNGTW